MTCFVEQRHRFICSSIGNLSNFVEDQGKCRGYSPIFSTRSEALARVTLWFTDEKQVRQFVCQGVANYPTIRLSSLTDDENKLGDSLGTS